MHGIAAGKQLEQLQGKTSRMQHLTTDPHLLISSRSAIASSAERIRFELDALIASLASMNSSWVGAAAVVFHDHLVNLRTQGLAISHQLDQLAQLSELAFNRYTQAESQATGHFLGS